jgi:hypothetical protein
MMGTGLTFSAGVGLIGSAIAGILWLLPGTGVGREELAMVVKSAIWAFPVGVAFSGFLAIAARKWSFDMLSLPRVALLGAGGGLLLFGLLAANAWQAWSTADAIVNGVFLVGLGSGSATASLLIARKARPALGSGEDPPRLGEG